MFFLAEIMRRFNNRRIHTLPVLIRQHKKETLTLFNSVVDLISARGQGYEPEQTFMWPTKGWQADLTGDEDVTL